MKYAELLKEVINELYNDVSLEDINANKNEFYYEFKSSDIVSEKDFEKIENKILEKDNQAYVKLIRISGVYYKGDSNNEMINRISGRGFDSIKGKKYLKKK